MTVEPRKEHQWLQKFVGEWTFEVEAADPGEPTSTSVGTETVRSFGGIWILAESHSQMPGGSPALSMMTLGYDPDSQQYVGTWVGSIMAYMWVYKGTLDPAERALSLETQGPAMTGPGKIGTYRDTIEFIDDDYRVLTSETQGDNGEWQRFMTAHYRRKR